MPIAHFKWNSLRWSSWIAAGCASAAGGACAFPDVTFSSSADAGMPQAETVPATSGSSGNHVGSDGTGNEAGSGPLRFGMDASAASNSSSGIDSPSGGGSAADGASTGAPNSGSTVSSGASSASIASGSGSSGSTPSSGSASTGSADSGAPASSSGSASSGSPASSGSATSGSQASSGSATSGSPASSGSASSGSQASSGSATSGSQASSGSATSGSPASSGSAACICTGGQSLYPTAVDCAALAIGLNKGQTMKACDGVSGFSDTALACGEIGTFVTCGAVTVGPGVAVCQTITTVRSVAQRCH